MGKASLTSIAQLRTDVKSFLKEAVEVPEEVPKCEEVFDEECADVEQEDSSEEMVEEAVETRPGQYEDILAELNVATSRWKETGKSDVDLAPAVSLSTRVKETLVRLKKKSAPHIQQVRDMSLFVVEKVMRQKKGANDNVQTVQIANNVEQEILNEWAVLVNISTEKDRARTEIDKLYNELADK